MTGHGVAENETKKPRIEDSAEEDRQPDTLDEEWMDEDGDETEPGPISQGVLLALLRRAIREKVRARTSDILELESKVEQRIQTSEKGWNEKSEAFDKTVQEIAAEVDSSIHELGAQMAKLESRLEALADRPAGTNSSTTSAMSWAGRAFVPSHTDKGSVGRTVAQDPIRSGMGAVGLPHKPEDLARRSRLLGTKDEASCGGPRVLLVLRPRLCLQPIVVLQGQGRVASQRLRLEGAAVRKDQGEQLGGSRPLPRGHGRAEPAEEGRLCPVRPSA